MNMSAECAFCFLIKLKNSRYFYIIKSSVSTEAVKGLQTSDFKLQTSDFRLQTSKRRILHALNAWHVVKHGLDSLVKHGLDPISKTWTRLVKHGLY